MSQPRVPLSSIKTLFVRELCSSLQEYRRVLGQLTFLGWPYRIYRAADDRNLFYRAYFHELPVALDVVWKQYHGGLIGLMQPQLPTISTLVAMCGRIVEDCAKWHAAVEALKSGVESGAAQEEFVRTLKQRIEASRTLFWQQVRDAEKQVRIAIERVSIESAQPTPSAATQEDERVFKPLYQYFLQQKMPEHQDHSVPGVDSPGQS